MAFETIGSGRIFDRGDVGYEAVRRGSMWNQRVPDRFNKAVVMAESTDDVVAAVKAARAQNLKITVRSGGHSWAATFLREDCILIDLSKMDSFSVNSESLTASVEPGLQGTVLNQALRKHDLFFPSGHCATVGLGGFLLQGGFGWNSRLWGPACVSVSGIQVVTATGDLLYANSEQNSDLFWAARGAGPGFFGVVTRFDLCLQPRPKVMMRSDYLLPIDSLEEVMSWALDVQPQIARNIEAMVFVRRDLFGHSGPAVLLTGPVMAENRDEAVEALSVLESCPVKDRAMLREVNVATEFDDLIQGGEDLLYPRGKRYASDNMWTSAPAADLVPGLNRIAHNLPAPPSHMMCMLWGPPQPLPDMAFSVQDNLYVALYSVWDDPSLDAEHQAWVTDHMRAMEPLSSGIQLADENLAARPFKFLADENFGRLQKIRARWDPSELFHSYMADPPSTD
jgi:FAD/FMN-containing dehydrogenase